MLSVYALPHCIGSAGRPDPRSRPHLPSSQVGGPASPAPPIASTLVPSPSIFPSGRSCLARRLCARARSHTHTRTHTRAHMHTKRTREGGTLTRAASASPRAQPHRRIEESNRRKQKSPPGRFGHRRIDPLVGAIRTAAFTRVADSGADPAPERVAGGRFHHVLAQPVRALHPRNT
jgi:hypothetical protein